MGWWGSYQSLPILCKMKVLGSLTNRYWVSNGNVRFEVGLIK